MTVFVRLLTAILGTAVARARRGPLRPSWSFMFEAMVAFLRATARVASGRSPLDQRAVWAALRPPAHRVMKRVRRERVDADGVPAEWFVPVEGHGEAVVLFAHGGSFIFGSNDSHAETIARIALAASARVLAIEYRRVPEATFPAPIEDMIAAYRWLRSRGVTPAKIVLAGDSAGGNLSIAALLAMRERGEPMAGGAVAICPWVDPPRSGGSIDEHERYDWGIARDFAEWCAAYAGGVDPTQPLLAPARAELAGLPPLLVLWGSHEMLRDQVRDFVARAGEAGVDITAREYPDMIHNWITLHAFTPEAEAAYVAIGEHVKRIA
ncbi:MAG: alpha/beta hydrolase [Myxococcales bacterium]|nr:alpha/beta hydrolase [Myxococcales bacterium]